MVVSVRLSAAACLNLFVCLSVSLLACDCIRGCLAVRPSTFSYLELGSVVARGCREDDRCISDIKIVKRSSPRENYLMGKVSGSEGSGTKRVRITGVTQLMTANFEAMAEKVRDQIVSGNLTKREAVEYRDSLIKSEQT